MNKNIIAVILMILFASSIFARPLIINNKDEYLAGEPFKIEIKSEFDYPLELYLKTDSPCKWDLEYKIIHPGESIGLKMYCEECMIVENNLIATFKDDVFEHFFKFKIYKGNEIIIPPIVIDPPIIIDPPVIIPDVPIEPIVDTEQHSSHGYCPAKVYARKYNEEFARSIIATQYELSVDLDLIQVWTFKDHTTFRFLGASVDSRRVILRELVFEGN